MRMSTTKAFAAGILAGGTMFMSYGVISQEYGGMTEDEMHKMCEKLAQPGPQHAELAKLAGKWKQSVKAWAWEDPSKPPTVTDGTAEFKPILGGRFITQSTQSKMEMNGEMVPFEGYGIFGYDNFKQKHFYVWFDSMGSAPMLAEEGADSDPSGKAITYYSEWPSPMGTMKFKSVTRTVTSDENYFEMYSQGEDGNWLKMLEIHGTRDGAPARAPASRR